MFCKNCGAEMADDAMLCDSCGSAAEIISDQPAESQKSTRKSLTAKYTSFIKNQKLMLVGAGSVLALLIAIVILVCICSGGNGYIAHKNAIVASIQDGTVMVLWNDRRIDTDIRADHISSYASCLDGSVYAFLTNNSDLAVVSRKRVVVVAQNVVSFSLSADGNGLAYVTEHESNYSLNLYNVGRKKSQVIDDTFSVLAFSLYRYALSPDGKSVAYYDFAEGKYEPVLMYRSGSKSIPITSSGEELLGLSNKGKYIYVIGKDSSGDDILYSYNTKGKQIKIGACSDSGVYFNANHTQIIFYNSGKTFISAKGKEANMISSGLAYLITSNDSSLQYSKDSYTAPVENLYGHVYVCYSDNQYNIWKIQKNSKHSVELVRDVSSWTLDADCEYLYYTNNKHTLSVLKIRHGKKASAKSRILAEDVEKYVVTADRSKVYYISDDALYSCNGKSGRSTKCIAMYDVDSDYLAINSKDVVYYIMDGNGYACSNGKKGSRVVSNVKHMEGYRNGTVYVYTDDAIHVTTGAKKLTKLWEDD